MMSYFWAVLNVSNFPLKHLLTQGCKLVKISLEVYIRSCFCIMLSLKIIFLFLPGTYFSIIQIGHWPLVYSSPYQREILQSFPHHKLQNYPGTPYLEMVIKVFHGEYLILRK